MKGKALLSVAVGAGLHRLGLLECSTNATEGEKSAFLSKVASTTALDGCVKQDLKLDQNMISK